MTAISMIDQSEETVIAIETAHATAIETESVEIAAANIEETATTIREALVAILAAKMTAINQDVEAVREMVIDTQDVIVTTIVPVVITIADAHVLQTIDTTDLETEDPSEITKMLPKIAIRNQQVLASEKVKHLIFN